MFGKRKRNLRDAGQPVTREIHKRTRFVFWILLIGFGYIAANLVRLHQFPDPRLETVERGRVGEATVKPPRGKIYDQQGHVLALDRMEPSLFAEPTKVESPYEVAQHLSALLEVDEDVLVERLTRRKDDGQLMDSVPIKRWLTNEEKSAVDALRPGIRECLYFRAEPARRYPEHQLAAHVLGYANRQSVGAAGIEARYDNHLDSKTGRRKGRVDHNRRLLASRTLEYEEARPGDDLWLTIMTPLQDALERELAAVMESVQADRANGIVMDPKTGAILAMASAPTFDPNQYNRADDRERKHTTVIDAFEPGSTFKIIPIAAALEEKLVTPNTLFDCENGAWRFNRHTINDIHPMGVAPVSEIIAESSNIGTGKISILLGEEKLSDWILRFGFGHPATNTFPGEASGYFQSNTAKWSKLSIAILPIGQEISCTTLQLARAYCVIANGGYMVQPHVVEKIVGVDGITTFKQDTAPGERILSAETAQIMRELCHRVVTDGTGWRANIDEFRVCGKTGTGQVARSAKEGGGYYPDRVTTVFAGFAPLADPELVCVIVVHDPKMPRSYGGNVCGPVFREVVRQGLLLLGTPKDPVAIKIADNPDAVIQDDADTINYTAIDELLEAELMRMAMDDLYGAGHFPDLSGLTLRQARARLAELKINWHSEGAGRVIRQTPRPGTPLDQVAECALVLGVPARTDHHEPDPTLPAIGD